MARMIKTLNPNDSLTGVLVDGVSGTPYVVGTLQFESGSGIRVEISYLEGTGTEQFASAERWFSQQTPPENLLFLSINCVASLYDCRFYGHSSRMPLGISVGRIEPRETILKRRDGDLGRPLEVTTLRSYFDGLNEWTGFSAIKSERITGQDKLIKKVVVEIESTQSMSWQQDSATMTLSTHWSTDPSDNRLLVEESVYLESSFHEPKPPASHLEEQRKIKALVALIHGTPVHFRKHAIKDASFTDRVLTGAVVNTPFCELYSQDTIREYERHAPNKKSISSPLATAKEIGVVGLQTWAANHKKWERYIYPALSALNVKDVGLENSAVNASIAIEAAGSLIGKVEGEEETYTKGGRPTTTTYSYRCLTKTEFDCMDIATSRIDLARAIANNYNSIKHFDRGEFPNPVETLLMRRTSTLAVRLLALRLTEMDVKQDSVISRKGYAFSELRRSFAGYQYRVTDGGYFVGTGDQNSTTEPTAT